MGLKIFNVKLSDISKIDNLLLTTRIKNYNKKYNDKDLLLSYFLNPKNKFKLGKLQRSEYKENGSFPIVDQSKELIVGYTNKKDLVYTGSLPIIVFGDHTRNFKYIDFPFVQGADGIKIITPDNTKVNEKFFYYLLSKISVPDRGYNRHFSLLKKQKYPNVDLNIQNKIVKIIEPIEKKIESLKLQKKEHLEIINEVFSEELQFDWNRFNILKSEKIFNINLIALSQNIDTRFSYGFTHKSHQYLKDFLFSKTNKKIKNFIKEDIKLGKTISPTQFTKDGNCYYISMATIKNYKIELDDSQLVSKTYEKDNKVHKLQQNDIVVSRSGVAIGKFALVENVINAINADFTIRIRLDEKKINPVFAYYFFRSDFTQELIHFNKKGLQNKNIFPSQIQEFPLLDFDLDHQEKIVNKIIMQIDEQKNIDKEIDEKQLEISELIENVIKENG